MYSRRPPAKGMTGGPAKYAHTWHRARCSDCFNEYGEDDQKKLEEAWTACQRLDKPSARDGEVTLGPRKVDVRANQMDDCGEYFWQKVTARPARPPAFAPRSVRFARLHVTGASRVTLSPR